MLYAENIGLRDCSRLLQIGSHIHACIKYAYANIHTYTHLMFSSITCRVALTSDCDTGCHDDTDLASNLYDLYKGCAFF